MKVLYLFLACVLSQRTPVCNLPTSGVSICIDETNLLTPYRCPISPSRVNCQLRESADVTQATLCAINGDVLCVRDMGNNSLQFDPRCSAFTRSQLSVVPECVVSTSRPPPPPTPPPTSSTNKNNVFELEILLLALVFYKLIN